MATIPNGVAPPGSANGDWASSLSRPPDTAKALTFAIAASTTHRELPSAESRASNGRMPGPLLNAVEVTRLRGPSARMRELGMVGPPVLTAQRQAQSGESS